MNSPKSSIDFSRRDAPTAARSYNDPVMLVTTRCSKKEERFMQQQLRLAVVGLALAISAVAAEKEKEHDDVPQQVALADLPAPARAAVEKRLAGGTVQKITKECEDGKIIYDVEATVKG